MAARSGSGRCFSYTTSSGPRQCSQIAAGAGSLSDPHTRHRSGSARSAARVSRSVLGDTRVHLVAPSRDTTGEIRHPLEAGRLQLAHRLRTALTPLTVHDDLPSAVQRRQRLAQRCQWNESSTWYARDLPLVRLSDVDEVNVLAAL